MSSASDFVIENGALKKYVGPGGDVVIPEGVTEVDAFAFQDCYKLERVILPEGVTCIKTGAFSRCIHLEKAMLPESLNVIGDWAFQACSRLTDVTIPENVTEIGCYAFSECGVLTDVSIPAGVAELKQGVFQNCGGLMKAVMNEGTTHIRDLAFSSCSRLTDLVIPKTVTDIGEHAFDGCHALTAVVIPENVTNIDVRAFRDCSSLTELTLPGGLRNIGVDAFYGTALYNDQKNWDGEVLYLCDYLMIARRSLSGSYRIKEGTRGICESAFANCRELRQVFLPDGMKTICGFAFKGCGSLESITIPGSVTEIGKKAFEGCGNLSGIRAERWNDPLYTAIKACPIRVVYTKSLPAEVPVKLRNLALLGFAAEEKEYSPDIAESYLEYAGKNAAKLAAFAMENPVLLQLLCSHQLIKPKDIDGYLAEADRCGAAEEKALLLDYQNRLGAENISKARTKKEKVKEEYEDALVERMSLRDPSKGIEGMIFVISGKLSEIWQSKKETKEYLEKYGAKLGSSISKKTDYLVADLSRGSTEKTAEAETLGVPVISEDEFNEMIGRHFRDAEQVRLPGWMKSIEKKTFHGCKSLKAAEIPDGVTEIGEYAFWDCKNLLRVSLPESVKTIRLGAFTRCSSLREIVLPEGIQFIDQYAFQYCRSLKTLTIPAGVSLIEGYAFDGCTELTDVTICGSDTKLSIWVFTGCPNLTIHAPAGSYAEQYAKENNIPFVAE